MTPAEIVLNGVRLVASQEARSAATALIGRLRSEPDWLSDVVNLRAKLGHEDMPKLRLLLSLIEERLRSFRFDEQSLRAYKVVFHELTKNAFEHGLQDRTGKSITLEVDLCSKYTEITVLNPSGRVFDLDRTLEEANCRLENARDLARGRGLINARFWSETLTSVQSGRGIRAMILPESVKIESWDLGGVLVLRPVAGQGNPSLERRLRERFSRKRLADVVLDFRTPARDGWSESSELISLTKLCAEALRVQRSEDANELSDRIKKWLEGMPLVGQVEHIINEADEQISTVKAAVFVHILAEISSEENFQAVTEGQLDLLIHLQRNGIHPMVRREFLSLLERAVDIRIRNTAPKDRMASLARMLELADGSETAGYIERKQNEIRDGKLTQAYSESKAREQTRTIGRVRKERGRLVVLLYEDAIFSAPPSSFAFSWQDVRRMLGRPNLQDPTVSGAASIGPLPPPIFE